MQSSPVPLRILLKTPVGLDSRTLGKLRERLECVAGRAVDLDVVVDRTVAEVALYFGSGAKVSLNLMSYLEELELALARLTREVEPSEIIPALKRTIEEFEPPKKIAKVSETGLKRALKGLRGDRVVLKTPVMLDSATLDALKRKLCDCAGRTIEVEVKLVPRAEGETALYLSEDKKLSLDLRHKWMQQFEKELSGLKTVEVGGDEIAAHIRKIISETESKLALEELGEDGLVLEVGNGLARVSGLHRVGNNEVVEFAGGHYGMAFNLQRTYIDCLLLCPEELIEEGTRVRRTGRQLEVPVGEAMLGRLVNALAQPIDAGGPVIATSYRPIERKAPLVVKRQPVKESLHTGTKILDALVPLGRGQRELIIGDRKLGKTTLALDAILSQKDSDVYCVYVSIGQKASTVARVVATLKERGALEYTVVVVALPNEQPSFRYIAPYTGCAIAEEFMEQGKHALVIYDDLSKHAVTYREVSSLLKRPIGREAYPGDIFYVHSRLLERAAKLADEYGGGSLTAIPIVETLAGDISAYIPTNVISICDGQIYLEASLFNEGFRPAMNPGLSVSRVGGAAQTPAMKKVSGRLRIDLAQYQEMSRFVKFGAEVDAATLAQLARGERGRELLKQAPHAPMPVEEETLVLFAVVGGYLDEVPVERVLEFEKFLIRSVWTERPEVFKELARVKDLTPEIETSLEETLAKYKKEFLEMLAAAAPEAVEAPEAEVGITAEAVEEEPVSEKAVEEAAVE